MSKYEIINYRGKWAVEFRDGSGERKRKSLGLDATDANYPAAQRAAIDFEKLIGAPVTDFLADVFAAYKAGKEGKMITHKSLDYSWIALGPFWGGLRVNQIDRKQCEAYANQRRAQGVGNGTILKELGVLRAAVNWSGEAGARWEFPASPPPRDRTLTRAEFDRLLAGSRSPHFTLWLNLAIATAGRKDAILGLKWADISFDLNRINLGYKAGGKARAVVPLTATLKALLLEAQKVARTDWVIEYKRQRVADIKRAFNEAAERAGLDDVTPHDIRHTAAVWMAGAGVPMSKISQFLGHSDSRITERVYAKYQPDHLIDAAAALDLGGAAKQEVATGSVEPKDTKYA